MTDLDSLVGLIEKIVLPMFKYTIPRIGKVVDVTDDGGRILVQVPSLGWDTNDKSTWCSPSDKNSLVVPKVGKYVLVEWIDGNIDLPIYRGIPTTLNDQIPVNYSGDPTFSVLFESNDNKNSITYDEKEDLMQIGKTDFRNSARVDDTITSSSAEDSAFWTFFAAFYGVVTGPPIPEPGNGSLSAFQATLASAITSAGGTPTKIDGKITSGSEQIKVGDKGE